MNQKQLANVLIKVAGLYLCAQHAASVIVAALGDLEITQFSQWATAHNFMVYLMSIIINLIPFAIGVFFIVRSKWLIEKFFSNEE